MKTTLFLFLTILSSSLFGQSLIDFGKVRNDSNFNCSSYIHVLEKKLYGLENICNSKNELEIRLSSSFAPMGGGELLIMSYNNQDWELKKYTQKRTRTGWEISSSIINQFDKNYVNKIYNSFFDSLKVNSIFLLPSQNELDVRNSVDDGIGYTLTFKAGNSFRNYNFDNPTINQRNNPFIPEFKQYSAIVKYLSGLF